MSTRESELVYEIDCLWDQWKQASAVRAEELVEVFNRQVEDELTYRFYNFEDETF